MTSTRCIAFITALVLLAGLLFQGNRMLSRQRAQLEAAQQRTETLSRQLADHDRTRDATLRELTLAEKQLADLSHLRASGTTAGSGSHDPEFALWIARVKRLQQIVAQHPDQRIPEMRVLTDDDWLSVARNRKLDSEEDVRRALAAVRTAAKDRFVATLTEAIGRFTAAATPDQTVALPRPGRDGAMTARTPPVTAMDLAPYLQYPSDADVLTRLAIFPNGSGWKLQEKDAIDPEYDAGYRITSDAIDGVTRSPWAWLPPDFDERSLRANQAYQAAHTGLLAPGFAERLPYFNPPLDPVIVQKLLKSEGQNAR